MRFQFVLIGVLTCWGCDCKDEPGSFIEDTGMQDATSDGSSEGSVGDGGGDAGDGGIVGEGCAERARWIYAVDSNDQFFRFEPDTLMFHQIGTGPLVCPGATDDAGVTHPFSMAIDHDAIAWVLYNDGDLYKVSTLDGSCEATAYVKGQMGFTQFGMGFSSNAPFPNHQAETMYIARGLGSADELGTLDTTTFTVSLIGGISGVPELTGNASAELWGFFPDNGGSTIRRMNKANGNTIVSYDLSMTSPHTVTAGNPNAWAFAFWGGSYYVFYKSVNDGSTDVYRLTPGATVPTSTFTRVIDESGRIIVGAGVSTCAPIVID